MKQTAYLFCFAALIFLIGSADAQLENGVVEVQLQYTGLIADTNCTECGSLVFFPEYDCRSDESSWNSGKREFKDPVPTGNLVTSINVTAYINFGCSNLQANTILIVVDSAPISYLPASSTSATCACENCATRFDITSQAQYAGGWPGYVYGGDNFLQFYTNSDQALCVSNVTVSLGYKTAIPGVTGIRPTQTPVNTSGRLDISGAGFLSSNSFYCQFGDQIVNATYISSTHLNCTIAPSADVGSVPFSLLVNDTLEAVYNDTFSYYTNPTIVSFSPTSGPSATPFNVFITGSGFFESSFMSCRFDVIPAKANFVNETTVECVNVADLWNQSSKNVSVYFSENSRDFVAAPGLFLFQGIQNPVSPSSSPVPASISASQTISINNTNKTPQSDSVPPFAWGALAITLFVVTVLVAGGVVLFCKRKKTPYMVIDKPAPINSSGYSADPNHIPIREIKNLRQIEKGSFGVIYEASWHGTKIAVKKLPSSMSQKVLEEFYQEAELMRTLRHPNILQYLGISHSGREICICMEFMPLGSLYRILHQPNSAFSRSRIKSICLDTARGMNYLHLQHPPIVHRDLKSHNLLVDKHWQVKVCDFGLSRIIAQNQTMTACGTPSWTAPEVLRNERYTTKADVYGFGVVVWEMFARADPFPGMPPFQIVFAVGTQSMRPHIDPSWPRDWIDLIKLCWNENPAQRPSFEELIARIEEMESPS